MNPNLIVLSLADNDYGQQLEQAAQLLHAQLGGEDVLVSERRVHEVVVDLVVALSNLTALARGFETDNALTRRHLHARLAVRFTSIAPTADHDGGSVAIDRNRNYIWRY